MNLPTNQFDTYLDVHLCVCVCVKGGTKRN